MVRLVRAGAGLRATARRFKVSLSHVQRWVHRAARQRLDRADLSDRPSGCSRSPRRTSKRLEARVLRLRRALSEGPLGEIGAAAIHRELLAGTLRPLPSVRTIGRILQRHGLLDGRARQRRPAPPHGWHLPRLERGRAEMDSFDIILGLRLEGGGDVEVLNAISVHGKLVGSWPMRKVTSKAVIQALIEHWRLHGLPDYAQFDNDTTFQGPHQFKDALGRVIRLCLALGVVPVFVPPRETGFQAAIENYNGQWQKKVWRRFPARSLTGLQRRSKEYVSARWNRDGPRIESIARSSAMRPSLLALSFGVASLPLGSPVELEVVMEVKA
jgi:hypothetical protein